MATLSRGGRQLPDTVHADRVGEPEVQQHARDVLVEEADRLPDAARPDQPGLGSVVQQLLDEQRVAVVVLDQQHARLLAALAGREA